MAISIRLDTVEDLGNSKFITGSVLLDSSYPTGGEAFAVNDTAQYDVTIERLAAVQASGGGYIGHWDKANQKLLVYYADNNNAADGPLIEVPNTTDLSAITLNFIGVGQ